MNYLLKTGIKNHKRGTFHDLVVVQGQTNDCDSIYLVGDLSVINVTKEIHDILLERLESEHYSKSK